MAEQRVTRRINGVRRDPKTCPGSVRANGVAYHSSECCHPNDAELLEKWLIENTTGKAHVVPYVKN